MHSERLASDIQGLRSFPLPFPLPIMIAPRFVPPGEVEYTVLTYHSSFYAQFIVLLGLAVLLLPQRAPLGRDDALNLKHCCRLGCRHERHYPPRM